MSVSSRRPWVAHRVEVGTLEDLRSELTDAGQQGSALAQRRAPPGAEPGVVGMLGLAHQHVAHAGHPLADRPAPVAGGHATDLARGIEGAVQI